MSVRERVYVWVGELDSNCSVTRFGEISPKWRNFERLWQFYEGFFVVGNILILIWQNANASGQSFMGANGQN